MTQKKEAETAENTSEQPVEEVVATPPKKLKKAKLFAKFFVFFILFFGVSFAAYQLGPAIYSFFKPKTPLAMTIKLSPKKEKQEIVFKDDFSQLNLTDDFFKEMDQKDLEEMEDVFAEEEFVDDEKIEDAFAEEEFVHGEQAPDMISDFSKGINSEFAVSTMEKQPEENQTQNINTNPEQNSYSILKAIQLREAFKTGDQCRPLLEELFALPNKTEEVEKALVNLLQICLDRPIIGQMQEEFKRAKKRTILRIFQSQYPTYLAYLKVLPYFVADIYHKNPTGDTPMDVLNRLQDAVYTDRPHLVLKLIPELPENAQATLYEVSQYALQEDQLYKTLNQLIKTFSMQGGNNE